MPAVASAHPGDHAPAQEHRRDEIDVEQADDVVGGERGEIAGEIDAGVVHEYVDRSVGLDTADDLRRDGGVGQIGRERLAAEVGGQLGRARPRSRATSTTLAPRAAMIASQLLADPA